MPKRIPKKIARDLAKLGEEVIKEGAKQPLEMMKEAGKQVFGLPRGWGEERETQLSARMVQEKEEERRRKLAMARKRINELTPAPSQPEPKEAPEEVKRQRELAEEAEKKKPVPEAGKKQKVPLGVKLRTKKSRAELGEWKRTG